MLVYQLDLTKRGIDVVQRTERPVPKPGPGQVLVRMHAWSLNYRDLLIINGMYPVASGANQLIPVCDGAGEVVDVGNDVSRLAKGDRVVTSFFQGWIDGPHSYPAMDTALGGAIDGVLAEYSALSAEGVVKIPDELSYEHAATLPCAGVTAWHALIESRIAPSQPEWLREGLALAMSDVEPGSPERRAARDRVRKLIAEQGEKKVFGLISK